ncbi:EF-hand domain-containing protein [Planctomycetales bacterium 10988]|nr:EF-hand domain-containing protein [Planctomycetales bacterium 10988]
MTNLKTDNLSQINNFQHRIQRIRGRVGGVALGYHTACYLVGRPGTSKTFTVMDELSDLDEPFAYRNARMTPMGLFDFIADHPEHVLVLDDIGTLFKNDQAMQILMAATGGDPKEPRRVTYKSKDKQHDVDFTGGIIAISNVPLRHDPLARAFGSRVVLLEHEPTDEEMANFMLQLASRGTHDLSPEERIEVAQFVIAETREHDQRLDLRHFNKAIQDFRQDRDGLTGCSWQELVRTSLQKTVIVEQECLSKRERIELDRERVREAMELFPGDTARQIDHSGLGKSTFYTRRKEVEALPQTA